jgi:hypothetical protein
MTRPSRGVTNCGWSVLPQALEAESAGAPTSVPDWSMLRRSYNLPKRYRPRPRGVDKFGSRGLKRAALTGSASTRTIGNERYRAELVAPRVAGMPATGSKLSDSFAALDRCRTSRAPLRATEQRRDHAHLSRAAVRAMPPGPRYIRFSDASMPDPAFSRYGEVHTAMTIDLICRPFYCLFRSMVRVDAGSEDRN